MGRRGLLPAATELGGTRGRSCRGACGGNHHHLVCRSCGAVKDVDCVVVGHPTCLDPVDDAGYLVDEADVTFWGLCPQCRPEAG